MGTGRLRNEAGALVMQSPASGRGEELASAADWGDLKGLGRSRGPRGSVTRPAHLQSEQVGLGMLSLARLCSNFGNDGATNLTQQT